MRLVIKSYMPIRQDVALESVRARLQPLFAALGKRDFDPDFLPFPEGLIFDNRDWSVKANLDLVEDSGVDMPGLRDRFSRLMGDASKYLRAGGVAVTLFDPETGSVPAKAVHAFGSNPTMMLEMGLDKLEGRAEQLVYDKVGRLDPEFVSSAAHLYDVAAAGAQRISNGRSSLAKGPRDTWTQAPGSLSKPRIP